jgi:glycosyltransferase involved in cell wall biosynthesis
MQLPTASVLICCFSFDRLPDTRAAIQSILDQTVAPHELILSVDNNPELAVELENTLPPSTIVVRNEDERGESATRNTGVAVATSEVIAFLDDDAVAEPDWLEKLLEHFTRPDVMVAGGQSLPAWERGEAPSWFPREWEFVVGCTGHTQVDEDGQVRNVTGSNMAVRRVAFEKLGDWKRELGRGIVKTGGSEAEMCMRIKNGFPGALIIHERLAMVHHKVPLERSSLKYVFPYVYNEGIVRAMLRKYLSPYSAEPLQGERRYLRSLVFEAIPSRLRRFYRPASLAQLAVILVNTSLVALGYARGRLMYR